MDRSKFFGWALLLPLLLLFETIGASYAASKVYKCLEPSGKVVFSDSDCGNKVEVIEYKHPETYLEKHKREIKESEERRAAQAEIRAKERAEWAKFSSEQKRKHDDACRARLAQKGLYIGIDKSDLYKDSLWQFPDDVSKTTNASGVTEYWVFKCDGFGSVRLFLKNGKLTSIHN